MYLKERIDSRFLIDFLIERYSIIEKDISIINEILINRNYFKFLDQSI